MPSLMLLIGLRYQIYGLLVNPEHPFAEFGCKRRTRTPVCAEQASRQE
jgi:hypothetical protein